MDQTIDRVLCEIRINKLKRPCVLNHYASGTRSFRTPKFCPLNAFRRPLLELSFITIWNLFSFVVKMTHIFKVVELRKNFVNWNLIPPTIPNMKEGKIG